MHDDRQQHLARKHAPPPPPPPQQHHQQKKNHQGLLATTEFPRALFSNFFRCSSSSSSYHHWYINELRYLISFHSISTQNMPPMSFHPCHLSVPLRALENDCERERKKKKQAWTQRDGYRSSCTLGSPEFSHSRRWKTGIHG